MALSERTVNRHNIKRAEVFAANGLNNLDIAYAHPRFQGYGQGECALCGQKNLKWLFSIRFDAPNGITALGKVMSGIMRDKEVTLTPIGSKCINDWLDAVPETMEKLEALKRWEKEMTRCKRAMKAKVIEDFCLKAGFGSPKAAYEALVPFMTWEGRAHARSVLTWYEAGRLFRNANKIRYKTAARGTAKTWLEDLAKVLAVPMVVKPVTQPPVVTPKPKPQAVLSTDDAALLARGNAVAFLSSKVLYSSQQHAFTDIAAKVKRNKKFVSQRQRKYYSDMVKRLEASASPQ